MHEMALTEQIVSRICEKALDEGCSAIAKVTLEIGQLSLVVPDAIQFYFDVCKQDTLAASAVLEIIEIPAVAQCNTCHKHQHSSRLIGTCQYCEGNLEWLSGLDLKIKEMEVI